MTENFDPPVQSDQPVLSSLLWNQLIVASRDGDGDDDDDGDDDGGVPDVYDGDGGGGALSRHSRLQ